MFKKITLQWRVVPVLALLFVALFATTCKLEGTIDERRPRDADRIEPKEPIITERPVVGLALKTTGPAAALTVSAVPQEEDGVISYQWLTYTEPAAYDDDAGTPATGAGATTGSFTPPINQEGVFYYYVRVTNTLARATTADKTASVKSEPSIVTVSDPGNAEFPAITALSGSGYYIAATNLSVTLGVTATVTAGQGQLSYEWFSTDGTATTEGDKLAGQTGATFTLPSAAAGTYFYYVEVTNTNNSASGRKTSVVAIPFTVNVVSANATVTVNTATKYQYVRGFGGMYTPWDNCPQEKLEDFERMFNPDILGLNMLRIMIKADNTDIEKTMNDMVTGRDGDNKDQSVYYDIVKIVNKYGGYVLASPWSPPAAWKTNNDVKGGGTLKTGNYKNFANYLRKFCEVMYNNGAPIYAVSHQNEPTFQSTSYEGCEYTTIEHRNWWQQVGGTEIKDGNGVVTEVRPFTYGVKGWGGGKEIDRVLTMTGEAHNNVSPFHTDSTSALQTANARQYIDIVGRHIYGAGVNPIPDNQRWGKEVWMTEHNINSGEGSYHNDARWSYVWKLMHDVDLTIRLNNENAFIWWTAKRFYSFVGDGWNDSGTIDGTLLARGYGLSHYAKFAKETTRVAVTGSGTTGSTPSVPINSSNFNSSTFNSDSTDVKVTAYESDDGKTISLVMYTPTDPNGGGGVNMGTVRIKLPDGFTVSRAIAMRSTDLARGVTESVIVCADKNSAIVTLPVSNILSVRFYGAD
jgi:O-glycosyl hydrolase